jgi:hypothetical protein
MASKKWDTFGAETPLAPELRIGDPHLHIWDETLQRT